jgi:RNA polymerase sigma-70 factor (ECF subfamily)
VETAIVTGGSTRTSSWGERAGFAVTRWTVVLAAADERSGAERRRALEELAQAYWFPLYAYIRRQGHAAPQAEDLTQEFFARLLEKKSLAAVDRDKGKFRSFLLASVKNFLADEWDKSRTLKRGGGQKIVALDALDAETRYRLEPADELTPERLFERRWILAVLDLVLARLGREYADQGHGPLFEALKGCLAGSAAPLGYAEVARRLAMTEGAVKMAAHRLRRQYRKLLRQEIAQTVASPELVDEEIRFLMNSL